MSTPIPTLAAPVNYMTLPSETESPKVFGAFLMSLTDPATLLILDPEGLFMTNAPYSTAPTPGHWFWP
ncbi:hypothetical protein COW20_15305 [bacterium (Candidatus Blackallbacteria) CG13_big_fil_rev_8_21_14_2_50_49_14]|nr:MAG: hypothetical protein COW64_15145 [bacterium (Candidatus Blackallbacteria) CG18_big_fil_WC_8_21_14_2_50_49_26]PIW46654.1 MAG: hypothetical protein COW20_15305 [bacterium (Candidatus Blackallbacteria) CG13_big_fil_rev_8_21_14_2_50_49_14]